MEYMIIQYMKKDVQNLFTETTKNSERTLKKYK